MGQRPSRHPGVLVPVTVVVVFILFFSGSVYFCGHQPFSIIVSGRSLVAVVVMMKDALRLLKTSTLDLVQSGPMWSVAINDSINVSKASKNQHSYHKWQNQKTMRHDAAKACREAKLQKMGKHQPPPPPPIRFRKFTLENSFQTAASGGGRVTKAKGGGSGLPTARKSLPAQALASTSASSSAALNGSLLISPSKRGPRSPRTSTPTRHDKRNVLPRLDLNGGSGGGASPVRSYSSPASSLSSIPRALVNPNEGGVRSVSVNVDPNTNRVETLITFNGTRYRFINTLTPQ
ncbi:hypothetical protein TYRP_010372 [Tyrophagus putrescentiae]|nr:hypothetical protein TYRP_010372 [Tyrophagus putrescentiae]